LQRGQFPLAAQISLEHILQNVCPHGINAAPLWRTMHTQQLYSTKPSLSSSSSSPFSKSAATSSSLTLYKSISCSASSNKSISDTATAASWLFSPSEDSPPAAALSVGDPNRAIGSESFASSTTTSFCRVAASSESRRVWGKFPSSLSLLLPLLLLLWLVAEDQAKPIARLSRSFSLKAFQELRSFASPLGFSSRMMSWRVRLRLRLRLASASVFLNTTSSSMRLASESRLLLLLLVRLLPLPAVIWSYSVILRRPSIFREGSLSTFRESEIQNHKMKFCPWIFSENGRLVG